MDNFTITHKDVTIKFFLDEAPIYLIGRGYVHVAELIGQYNRDQVESLKELTINLQKVSKVEYWAIDEYHVRKLVGLIFNKRLW